MTLFDFKETKRQAKAGSSEKAKLSGQRWQDRVRELNNQFKARQMPGAFVVAVFSASNQSSILAACRFLCSPRVVFALSFRAYLLIGRSALQLASSLLPPPKQQQQRYTLKRAYISYHT